MATIVVSENKNTLNPNARTFEERQKELDAIDKAEAEARKREKDSPFKRWTQFNLEQTPKMLWLQLKHPKAAAILFFLVDQMDEYNAVMCSYRVFQEVLEVGQATVARCIKILKENGYIAVLKSGTSNVYAINDTLYWKSWGKNRAYSKFPANVVLTLSEQEKEYQEMVKAKKIKEARLIGPHKKPSEQNDGEVALNETSEVPANLEAGKYRQGARTQKDM
jgi:DNA-binding transcriptional ArsR family regulator